MKLRKEDKEKLLAPRKESVGIGSLKGNLGGGRNLPPPFDPSARAKRRKKRGKNKQGKKAWRKNHS